MNAEEIVKARAEVGLPSKMRVKHEKYGMTEVWAFCRTQAEVEACLVWKCRWSDEREKLHISVLRDQSGYEQLLAEAMA